MHIDINVQQIDPKTRVWRLFPGQNYKFQKEFFGANIGFLDLPGIRIEDIKKLSAVELIKQIAKSDNLKNRILKGEAYHKIVQADDDFRDARSSQARGRIANSIINFYRDARKGDIVIIPEPLKNSMVRIGAFRDDEITDAYYGRYGEAPIPARHIDWINSVKENTISSELSESLRNQHPFTLVEKSRFLEVFALRYPSLVIGDRHVATIFNRSAEYLDADSALISHLSKLAAAACSAIDSNQSELGGKEIFDIIINHPDIAYTCNQASDIHSPGFNRLTSGSSVPFVVVSLLAILIALSACSSEDAIKDQIASVQITNSLQIENDVCSPIVSEATRRILQTMDMATTIKLCRAARESNQRAQFGSSVRVELQTQPQAQ